MTEYSLNQLTGKKLAELARNSATFLATITRPSAKLELYYLEEQFIEISYRKKKLPDSTIQWQLYSANHFPDIPDNTSYLAIYLPSINLLIDQDAS